MCNAMWLIGIIVSTTTFGIDLMHIGIPIMVGGVHRQSTTEGQCLEWCLLCID